MAMSASDLLKCSSTPVRSAAETTCFAPPGTTPLDELETEWTDARVHVLRRGKCEKALIAALSLHRIRQSRPKAASASALTVIMHGFYAVSPLECLQMPAL